MRSHPHRADKVTIFERFSANKDHEGQPERRLNRERPGISARCKAKARALVKWCLRAQTEARSHCYPATYAVWTHIIICEPWFWRSGREGGARLLLQKWEWSIFPLFCFKEEIKRYYRRCRTTQLKSEVGYKHTSGPP